MVEFVLDKRLKDDCHLLAESGHCLVLLMNNSLFRWFIIVPVTDETELYRLPVEVRKSIRDISDRLSHFLIDSLGADKLNIAAIGNIVSQLHVHVVGRFKNDICWPGVVWGTSEQQSYSISELNRIKKQISAILPSGAGTGVS